MDRPSFVQQHVALAPRCTMGVGGQARFFVCADSVAQIQASCRWAQQAGIPTYVLGAGSNLLIADAGYDGLMLSLSPAMAEVTVRQSTADEVRMRCAAAAPWDAIVAQATAAGWAGIECLSGIPGTVGAAPVQNIGAYGQEVGDVLQEVRVVERHSGALRTLAAEALGLGYRSSHLKGRWAQQYVVVEVALALRPGGRGCVAYAQVAAALQAQAPTPAAVRAAVLRLRAAKGMLWEPGGAAHVGSFFINPTVSGSQAAALRARFGLEMPQTPLADGQVKLAAAWLLEKAGCGRGLRRGAVGLAPQHALCVRAYPGATAAQVVAFAAELQQAVWSTFAVALQIEPDRIGFAKELP